MLAVWTEAFQRAYLCALLTGKVGHQADALNASLFTDERRTIAAAILAFKKEHGEWPPGGLLSSLVAEEARDECALVLRQVRSAVDFAAKEGGTVVRREALRRCAIDIAEMSEGSPSKWEEAERMVQAALAVGQPAPSPFTYIAADPGERHELPPEESGKVLSTGIRALDDVRGGGFHPGELVFILGPTGRGKSHLAVWFGTQALRKGVPVVHLTLELDRVATACRYDRCLSGLTSEEIRADHARLRSALDTVPGAGRLGIEFHPRGSLSLGAVRDLLRRRADQWGHPPLLIVDYYALLKADGDVAGWERLSALSAGLGRIAQEESTVVVSPFQLNRAGYQAGEGGEKGGERDANLGDAGGSYDALTHPDYVLVMQQKRRDVDRHEMTLAVEKDRSWPVTRARVKYDWARSTILSWD